MAESSTEIWLRLEAPDLSPGEIAQTESVYQCRKAYLNAEARVIYRAFRISELCDASARHQHRLPVRSSPDVWNASEVRLEVQIEFEAKFPLRKADKFELAAAVTFQKDKSDFATSASSCSSDCGAGASLPNSAFPTVSASRLYMETRQLNRDVTETWIEIAPLQYRREKNHREPLELRFPAFLKGLVLPAALAPQALRHAWNEEATQFKAVVLAGKEPIALRITPVPGEHGDGVPLEIEFIKFSLSQLGGTIDGFDRLSWGRGQKMKSVYSRSEGVITRFELELPFVGAISLQKMGL